MARGGGGVGGGTGGGHRAGGEREGSEDRQEHGVRDWGLVILAAAGTMAVLLGESGKTACCSAHQLQRGFNDSNTVEKVRTSHNPPRRSHQGQSAMRHVWE